MNASNTENSAKCADLKLKMVKSEVFGCPKCLHKEIRPRQDRLTLGVLNTVEGAIHNV